MATLMNLELGFFEKKKHQVCTGSLVKTRTMERHEFLVVHEVVDGG